MLSLYLYKCIPGDGSLSSKLNIVRWPCARCSGLSVCRADSPCSHHIVPSLEFYVVCLWSKTLQLLVAIFTAQNIWNMVCRGWAAAHQSEVLQAWTSLASPATCDVGKMEPCIGSMETKMFLSCFLRTSCEWTVAWFKPGFCFRRKLSAGPKKQPGRKMLFI